MTRQLGQYTYNYVICKIIHEYNDRAFIEYKRSYFESKCDQILSTHFSLLNSSTISFSCKIQFNLMKEVLDLKFIARYV